MVHARQLRLHHPDAHSASAIFRYQKEFACMFRDFSHFIPCDDKHTIKVGEPNHPVAAVERGKAVLCRISGDKKLFKVADHDFTKSSFTPSVHMDLDIPETIEGSFYRGKVHVGIKDNAFEASSAWRHASELKEIMENDERLVKPILLLYPDGDGDGDGDDHNITSIKTQLSLIALFLGWDLDFLCAVRTPPHHSWKNPVERIMSILNIALNAVGMMRTETKSFEDKLKSVSNLKGIRKLSEIIGFKDEYLESLQDAKKLLQSLFVKLKLKDEYFQVFQPAFEEGIGNLRNVIPSTFGATLTNDIKKSDLGKYSELSEFLSTHCQIRHFMFSIKKWEKSCKFGCKPPRLPMDVFTKISHLPDPVPEINSEHYKAFSDSYGKPTSEEHRPSLKETKKKDHGMPFSPSAQFAKNTDTFLQV